MRVYRINVYNHSGQVGECICEISPANGRARGAFKYSREYLSAPERYAIDPLHLPLSEDVFNVEHPGVFGVFVDSLPDDWGRKLLVRKKRLPRSEQNIPALLLALGGAGLGALMYAEDGLFPDKGEHTQTISLERLLVESELFESGECNDDEITQLLSAGSSPGGARPKALVQSDGKHYLAKFPSNKDVVEVVLLEAATMSLAKNAGLNVPYTKLVMCNRKPVLLVERFDMVPGGRRHMISMQTLLKAEGYYQCRYKDMLDVIRRVSQNPAEDSGLLFRQMVFNGLAGNTDDHLKNFWMLCTPTEGWRLSPSFDLVPDIRRSGEHVLFFDTSPYCLGREQFKKLGQSWGISKPKTILDEVYDAVSQWTTLFQQYGVVTETVNSFSEINKNLNRGTA